MAAKNINKEQKILFLQDNPCILRHLGNVIYGKMDGKRFPLDVTA